MLKQAPLVVLSDHSISPSPLAGRSQALVVKKASEFGAAEAWMNERVRRACPKACAEYVYGFVEVSWDMHICWQAPLIDLAERSSCESENQAADIEQP